MDEVKAVLDDDEWELTEELGFFKEVYDLLANSTSMSGEGPR